MTDSEILNKAIEKSIKNGANPISKIFSNDAESPWLNTIIFSHDFAKAFWGDNDICLHGVDISFGLDSECSCAWEGGIRYPAWQYHLSKMVLEPEPLKYLKRFLD